MTTVECVVIVGLSLDYDLDLKRLIYAQNVHEKIVFIEDSKISEDKKRKVKEIWNGLCDNNGRIHERIR